MENTCTVLCLQEYVPTSHTNLVVSLMRFVEMLMKESCAAEDVAENRHLRNWLVVRTH